MKSKDLRLLLSLGSSRKLFFGAILGALVTTSLVIGQGFLIASIVVGVIYSHPSLGHHILELALLWAVRSLWVSLFDRWASGQASALKAQLRSSVLSAPSILISHSSTHVSTLLVKGGNSLDIYLARFLPQIFSASLTPLALIVAIGFLDPISALTAILTLPLIPFFGALIGRYTQDAVTAKWRSMGILSKYFEDSLRGIHTLSIFGRLTGQSQRIGVMGDRYTDETMKVLRISFLSALVLELAATISVALIAVSIGLRLVSGSIEFFPALAVLVLAPEVYLPLRNAASLFHASADGGAALGELHSLVDEAKPLPQGHTVINEIQSVSWDRWMPPYEGLSSILPAATLVRGEAAVIRGGSGLGKTTFLNQLLGIAPSTAIAINGEQVQKFDRTSLHSMVGWIPQTPNLMSADLRTLFRSLVPAITDEDIERSLSGVSLTLQSLPHGLETHVGGLGEKSAELSGGQIRRIAIARALVRKPALIIADEPTADLDPDSAQEILAILGECSRNGAIVVVALHAPDQGIDGARELVMVEG